MTKRKASLGLQALSSVEKVETFEENTKPTTVQPVAETGQKVNTQSKKKQPVPLYVAPLLHDALHALVFSERHKKTSFQTLFMEGLDLLLEKRGLPSVEQLSSGEKTINP
jgi:hypothetical protein